MDDNLMETHHGVPLSINPLLHLYYSICQEHAHLRAGAETQEVEHQAMMVSLPSFLYLKGVWEAPLTLL